MRSRPDSREHGFTLAEVLVAMALTGAVVAPLLLARANAVRQVAEAHRFDQAVSLAERELARAKAEVLWPVPEVRQPEAVAPPPGLQAHVTVTRQRGTKDVELFEVEVAIRDAEHPGDAPLFMLAETVARPIPQAVPK